MDSSNQQNLKLISKVRKKSNLIIFPNLFGNDSEAWKTRLMIRKVELVTIERLWVRILLKCQSVFLNLFGFAAHLLKCINVLRHTWRQKIWWCCSFKYKYFLSLKKLTDWVLRCCDHEDLFSLFEFFIVFGLTKNIVFESCFLLLKLLSQIFVRLIRNS